MVINELSKSDELRKMSSPYWIRTELQQRVKSLRPVIEVLEK